MYSRKPSELHNNTTTVSRSLASLFTWLLVACLCQWQRNDGNVFQCPVLCECSPIVSVETLPLSYQFYTCINCVYSETLHLLRVSSPPTVSVYQAGVVQESAFTARPRLRRRWYCRLDFVRHWLAANHAMPTSSHTAFGHGKRFGPHPELGTSECFSLFIQPTASCWYSVAQLNLLELIAFVTNAQVCKLAFVSSLA